MTPSLMDAVVLAGGRISGLYARGADTTVKALAPVRGVPVVLRLIRALRDAPGVGRICVVGPEAVRDVLDNAALWQPERTSAADNLRAGLERLGADAERVLVCGTDVPAATGPAIQDFLDRAPQDVDVCMPIVRKEPFTTVFPGNLGIYVRLVEGSFTAGSQVLIRPRVFQDNEPLLRRLFDRRKSQLGMAAALGSGLVWRLIRHELTVGELEARISQITGCRARAVLDCHPELAFDLDNLLDLRYIEGWMRERETESGA